MMLVPRYDRYLLFKILKMESRVIAIPINVDVRVCNFYSIPESLHYFNIYSYVTLNAHPGCCHGDSQRLPHAFQTVADPRLHV